LVGVAARWRRGEALNSDRIVLPWIGWEISRPHTWQ
jgi:hypothetical protein